MKMTRTHYGRTLAALEETTAMIGKLRDPELAAAYKAHAEALRELLELVKIDQPATSQEGIDWAENVFQFMTKKAPAGDILAPAPAGEKVDPLIQAVLDTF